MSSPQPATDTASDVAKYLKRTLTLQRVLHVAGDRAPLAEALRSYGVEVSEIPSASDPIACYYDLVLCGQLDVVPGTDAVTAVRNMASVTNAVVCEAPADEESLETSWLQIFRDLGFYREALDFPGGHYRKLVLLRRGASLTLRGDELLRLREDMAELRSTVADLLESTATASERIDGHIAQLQSKSNQVSHDVQSMLNSRIWRTLVKISGWVLRLASFFQEAAPASRPRQPAPAVPAQARTEAVIRVFCDEPRNDDKTPVSGKLIFRGWAVASSGIDRVEIEAGGHTPAPARYGLYRPDIPHHFPGMPDREFCGFQVYLDTTPFGDGPLRVVVRAISKQGVAIETELLLLVDHVHGYASDYYRWIAEFEKRDPKLIQMRLQSFRIQPRISVLVPVYRTPAEILEKTIDSVLAQSYSNWDLCLADDGSQSPEIDRIFTKYSTDSRIKTVQLPQNGGISKASNAALAMATGDYIALLDHDDELAVDALYHVVHAINRDPDAEIFYSDEDHIDEAGVRSDPFFKPDWSPDLILSENYVTHFMVFRTDLALAVGGFRSECDLGQDHDILLRMSLKAKNIIHIPRILYHWRTDVFTIHRASSSTEKALATSRRAIDDYLKLANIKATVEPGAVSGRWRVRYDLPKEAWVDIIMPCGGRIEILERCLDSIASRTEYPFYKLTVVDNSHSDAVETFLHGWSKDGHRAQHLDWRNRPFNFSVMNNVAAQASKSPLLLFLNDDTSVVEPGWLTAMVELAIRPEVGAVGAKLLYPDNRIQHAGVTVGLFNLCGHGFKGVFDDERVYFDFPDVIRNVSAVTAACLLTRAEVFAEAGGFDVEYFPVAYQDVDLCLTLVEKGYRILYTPHAKLYHYEAVSKNPEDMNPRVKEMKAFQAKWKRYIEADPFYNPNLTQSAEDFSLRKKSST
jgi:O-antigen biosynthesis protein